jgi:hypothetical protein
VGLTRLVGHYDSPFVRRVGVSLTVLGIQFERQLLSSYSSLRQLLSDARIGCIQCADARRA